MITFIGGGTMELPIISSTSSSAVLFKLELAVALPVVFALAKAFEFV